MQELVQGYRASVPQRGATHPPHFGAQPPVRLSLTRYLAFAAGARLAAFSLPAQSGLGRKRAPRPMGSLSYFTLAIPRAAWGVGWTLERRQNADVAAFGLGTHGGHP